MSQTLTQKSILARLLAKENIEVVQGNYQTAFFDVENRVLGLPHFKDVSKDLYDLLVGHEVGHALYTPADGWHDSDKEIPGVPRAFVNIVEDIRIEKKILREYPGLIGGFKRGYNDLLEKNFFGIKDKNVNEMSFMDRLNIFAKSRGLVDVEFSEEEKPYLDMAMKVEKWEDVLSTCKTIAEWLGSKSDEDKKEEQEVEIEIPVMAMPDENSDDDVEQEEQTSGNDGEDDQPEEQEEDSDGSSSDENDEQEEEQDSDSSDGASDDVEEEKEEEEAKLEPAQTGGSDAGNTHQDPLATNTDETFRENEKSLVNDVTEKDGVLHIKGIAREQFEISKVSFKEQEQKRNEFLSKGLTGAIFPQDKYDAWLKDAKVSVNVLVKEFEMRKAAYRTLRARTSTKGSLDVTKLHKYKYDDNLFKQVTHLADSKSHGMLMFIDFSGSMSRVIESVLRQTLILSMFCDRVGIPYEVYGFTDAGGKLDQEQKLWLANNTMHTRITAESQVTEMLTSSMSKADKQQAVKYMFNIWRHLYYQSTIYDTMRGTPLNEVYMAAHYICDDFQKKYNVQKMNVTFLTDGYSDRLYFTEGDDIKRTRMLEKDGKPSWFSIGEDKRRLGMTELDFRGNTFKIDMASYDSGSNEIGPQQVLLNNLKKEFGCSLVHYFIADSAREFRSQIGRVTDYSKFEKEVQNARKSGAFVIDNNYGFDRRLILEARGDILRYRAEEGELEVNETMTASQIATAFKKQAGSKHKKSYISRKFAEMVA